MTSSAASPASEGNGRKAQMLKERGNSFYVRHQVSRDRGREARGRHPPIPGRFEKLTLAPAQFAQAIEWYTKAIEENPMAFDVYTNRASTYAALKMWEEGLSDAREAVRIQPDWVKGHWRAGVCLVQLKQYQEAAKCFEEALKINPKSDQILSELKSVRDHLKAMPTSAEEAKRQGNQCFREGKFERAIQLYKESLVLVKDEDDKDLEATLLINR